VTSMPHAATNAALSGSASRRSKAARVVESGAISLRSSSLGFAIIAAQPAER
jgi:hypothetical protein